MTSNAIAVIYGGLVGGLLAGLILLIAQRIRHKIDPEGDYWILEVIIVLILFLAVSISVLIRYG